MHSHFRCNNVREWGRSGGVGVKSAARREGERWIERGMTKRAFVSAAELNDLTWGRLFLVWKTLMIDSMVAFNIVSVISRRQFTYLCISCYEKPRGSSTALQVTSLTLYQRATQDPRLFNKDLQGLVLHVALGPFFCKKRERDRERERERERGNEREREREKDRETEETRERERKRERGRGNERERERERGNEREWEREETRERER